MNPNPPDLHELESLAAESGWLDGLARSLVADAHLAEDLVQDAWVAALAHGSGARGPLSAWMAGALKRLAANRRRGDARRARREREASPERHEPPVSTGTEMLEQQQLLIQHVLTLDEPYREVVVRRYVDGLPPREIARALDVPVATVNSRLARGLAKLRATLLAAHDGDETRWLGAMVSLATLETKDGMVLLGVALMKTKIALASAVLLVLFGGAWTAGVAFDRGELPPAVEELAEAPVAEPPAVVRSESGVTSAEAQVTARREAVESSSAAALAEPWLVRVVHGETDTPAPGAQIFVAEKATQARMNQDPRRQQRERLQFEVSSAAAGFERNGEEHLADGNGELRIERPESSPILVAKLGDATGYLDSIDLDHPTTTVRIWSHGAVFATVVDTSGRPVEGVQVGVRVAGAEMPYVLDRAWSDEDGHARLRPWLVQEEELEVNALEAFVDLPGVAEVATALDLDAEKEAQVKLVVPDFGSVALELWLDERQPLPDGSFVSLSVAEEGQWWPRMLRSGVVVAEVEDGRVNFPHVGLGCTLDVSIPVGPHQELWEARLTGPGQPGEQVRERIVLGAASHRYTGRVTVPGGWPLEGGELFVTYTDASRSGHRWLQSTDSEGRFEFELVGIGGAPEGELRFVPWREGGSRVEVQVELEPYRGSGPHELGRIHLEPEPAPVLSGIVVDPFGQPVPEVWVSWLDRPDGSPVRGGARTDADGRFTFYGEFGTDEVFLSVYSEGRWRHEPVRVVAASSTLRLELEGAAAITGRLLVDEGTDTSEVIVGAWPMSQGEPAARHAHGWRDVGLASDGSFAVRGLDPGFYAVAVDFASNGGKLAAFEGVEAHADGAQDPRLNPVDLRGQLRTVTVHVTDHRGRQVIADLWFVPDVGRPLSLGRGPELVIDRRLQGFVVAEVGPSLPAFGRLGNDDVLRLESPAGQEVEVHWDADGPLADYDATFQLELWATGGVFAGSAEPAVAALALRLGDRAVPFGEDGRCRLRVPGPGSYQLRWSALVQTPEGERLHRSPIDGELLQEVVLGAGQRRLEAAPPSDWAEAFLR